jgi:hypothetical protein
MVGVFLLLALALAKRTIDATLISDANNALAILDEFVPRAAEFNPPDNSLKRRKGGGGHGGSHDGSHGGGHGAGSRGSGSSGGSSVGGSTRTGSGSGRPYGQGGYYGGGAAVPYQAGLRTPRGLEPGTLITPLAALDIMSGIWLYSVYPYYYNDPYKIFNRSATKIDSDRHDFVTTRVRQETQGANETLPVICLCQQFLVCACDENHNQQYINELVGNGSYAALNKSLVIVSGINGTKTLVLNGSLPNDTTAPGGVDDFAAGLDIRNYYGYWFMALVVLYGATVQHSN